MITAKKLKKMELSEFAGWQVAEMFKVCESTVHNYVNRGVRVSNDIYIRLEKHGTRFKKESLIKFREQIDA